MNKVHDILSNTQNVMIFLKLVIFMVLMIASMMLFIGNIQSAAAQALRTDIMIDGEDITVGDIFEGIYANADYVLGPAPEPGEKMVLNSVTLHRIARSFDISWSPSYRGQTATLRRSSNIIGMKDATRHLVQALKDELNNALLDVELDTAKFHMNLPENSPRTLRIENISLNSASKSFTATLIAPAKGLALRSREVSGQYFHITHVPVLRERVRSGDLIDERDLDYIKMRDEEIASNIITNTDNIIGYTPRRAVIAGTPIRSKELVAPKVIDRGDHITIVYNNGPIQLSAQGRALQSGAKNDMIRVTNLTSNRTIEARITNERKVLVPLK